MVAHKKDILLSQPRFKKILFGPLNGKEMDMLLGKEVLLSFPCFARAYVCFKIIRMS